MELWQTIVAICAGVVTLLTLLEKLGVLKSKLKKPLEDIKSRLDDGDNSFADIKTSMTRNELAILRMELIQLLELHPERESMIYKVYDKYEHLGGNSYVTELMEEYKLKKRKERE